MSTAQKTRTATQASREAFIEDAEFLAQHKVGLSEAARRLGYGTDRRARDNVRNRLRRCGREDLLQELTRNEDPYGPDPAADLFTSRKEH